MTPTIREGIFLATREVPPAILVKAKLRTNSGTADGLVEAMGESLSLVPESPGRVLVASSDIAGDDPEA